MSYRLFHRWCVTLGFGLALNCLASPIFAGDLLALIDAQRKSYAKYDTVIAASDALEAQVRETVPTMPDDFRDEFRRRAAAQFADYISSLDQYSIKDYKAACLAIEMLQMRSQLVAMQFYPVGETAAIREKASEDYDSALTLLHERLDASRDQLDPEIAQTIQSTIATILQHAQSDVFSGSFGRPLREEDRRCLTSAIEDGIREACDLSKELKSVSDAERSSKELAFESRLVSSASECISRQSQTVFSSDKVASKFSSKRKEVEELKKQCFDDLAKAESLEVRAIAETMEEQQKQMAEEDKERFSQLEAQGDSRSQ